MKTLGLFSRSRVSTVFLSLSALHLLTGCLTLPVAQGRPGFHGFGTESSEAKLNRMIREEDERTRPQYPIEPPGTLQNPRFVPRPLDHGSPISVGSFREGENTWTLNHGRNMPPRQGSVVLPGTSGNNTKWGRTIRCIYGFESNYRSVVFWNTARPVIDRSIPKEELYKWAIKEELAADVAITECPAKWGDALVLVWGQGAWERLQASAGASRSRLEQKAERERAISLQAAHQRELEADFERLPEREKCLRRNGLVEPGSTQGSKGALYGSRVMIACGRYPQ